MFAHFTSYTGAAISRDINNNNTQTVTIYFNKQEDRDEALKLPIPTKESNQDNQKFFTTSDAPTTLFVKDKSIKVSEIPLNVDRKLLISVFKRFGTITRLTMQTYGLWQIAIITFDDITANQFYVDQWYEYILKDAVNVTHID